MKIQHCSWAKTMAACWLVGVLGAAAIAGDTNLPIRVNSPRKLGGWTIPAERIPFGPGYKPSLALLPNGELLMIALFQDRSGPKLHEWSGLWRSRDGGKTWSDRVRVETKPGQDLIGREHWLTSIDDGTPNGILFTTCTLLEADTANTTGYNHSYISRSTDGGRTWTQTRIGPEGFVEPKPRTVTSRNVVKLIDGRLLLGVSDGNVPGTDAYVWTSNDKGVTWQQSPKLKIGTYTNARGKRMDFSNGGFFCESYLFLNKSGKLLNLMRVERNSPLFPLEDGRVASTGDDDRDRTLICESANGGLTWGDFKDWGDYGMHYARIIRLADGRLLMTFTQRALIYPIGLQAILSDDEGQTWDFAHDRITIEGRTPWGGVSGGGFGNTLQLKDGSLISCYSYQDSPTYWTYDPPWKPKIEVVRWRLPEAKTPAINAGR